jgi:hypothetical protein
MRRLVWVGVGVVVTVVVLREGRKVLRRYSPVGAVDDVAARANDLGERLTRVTNDFGSEFRSARAAREAELRASLLAEGQADPEVVRAARHAAKTERERDAQEPQGPLPQDPEDPDTGYAFF